MSATQAERRSAINHELFEPTDEIKEAMEKDIFLDAGHPAAIIDIFYGYYTGIMSCRIIWDSVVIPVLL